MARASQHPAPDAANFTKRHRAPRHQLKRFLVLVAVALEVVVQLPSLQPQKLVVRHYLFRLRVRVRCAAGWSCCFGARRDGRRRRGSGSSGSGGDCDDDDGLRDYTELCLLLLSAVKCRPKSGVNKVVDAAHSGGPEKELKQRRHAMLTSLALPASPASPSSPSSPSSLQSSSASSSSPTAWVAN
mmetsp:Transcript_72829/g.146613  ORF Transcript_72829/g.146613 Transcript_72829/m.146613 type:complete len:185 (-) Transcript_72829:11-565(-)